MPSLWSREDVVFLMQLRDKHKLEWDDIAARLRRSPASVKNRYHDEKRSPEARERRRTQVRELCRENRSGLFVKRKQRDPNIDQRISVARDLQHRDLSSELLGDPPIGRSALDQKQGTYVP